ncbi:zinc ribbon domain-containing protein [Streptomyces adustus]|uniref:zinc ribbon domain-containing protein n=1 Tax=Streptomyces adustus TaxID=1609272 RepID=UPI003B75BF90
MYVRSRSKGSIPQTCSTCGAAGGPKPLSVREWTCTACGTLHDRDTNAALNVRQAAGLAASACGAPVSPEPVPAQREETSQSRCQAAAARGGPP